LDLMYHAAGKKGGRFLVGQPPRRAIKKGKNVLKADTYKPRSALLWVVRLRAVYTKKKNTRQKRRNIRVIGPAGGGNREHT